MQNKVFNFVIVVFFFRNVENEKAIWWLFFRYFCLGMFLPPMHLILFDILQVIFVVPIYFLNKQQNLDGKMRAIIFVDIWLFDSQISESQESLKWRAS